MIDKNGKLFGKISIVDIIIVLLSLAAILFILFKLNILSPGKVSSSSAGALRITFYQEEVNDFTADNVKLDDITADTILNIGFGRVVDFKKDKSVSWSKDINGIQVKSAKEGRVSVYITTEVAGALDSNGININGTRYYVGQLITLRVGTSKFYARLYSAEEI